MEERSKIVDALNLIFQGIGQLIKAFPKKEFTIDGRLVGDIGEMIAALEYDIELFDALHKGHDGRTSDGRLVQVKATFKDSLTFKSVPEYYLGLKLYEDGRYDEIYNGPGKLIFDKYRHRSSIGKELLSFPNTDLKQLSANVIGNDRVPKRKSRLFPLCPNPNHPPPFQKRTTSQMARSICLL